MGEGNKEDGDKMGPVGYKRKGTIKRHRSVESDVPSQPFSLKDRR